MLVELLPQVISDLPHLPTLHSHLVDLEDGILLNLSNYSNPTFEDMERLKQDCKISSSPLRKILHTPLEEF